jgi:hypothetical protein
MPASAKNFKITAILPRITRRRLAALSAAAAISGIALTSLPAHAAVPRDVYTQKCNSFRSNEICVSYDYTSGALAANYYNGTAQVQAVNLTLSYGSWGQTKGANLAGQSWFGFYTYPGSPPSNACAAAVTTSFTLSICGSF